MAHIANLNGISEALLSKLKPFNVPKRVTTCQILNKAEELNEQATHSYASSFVSLQPTRRKILGLAATVLSMQSSNLVALAEDNGYWITGPIPIPPVYNKIANEQTGTRSFLKKGLYIANIGTRGSAYRIRKYAFDLMAMSDLIGKDSFNYVRHYLGLKSSFLYYDFDKVISAAPVDDKQPLTELANRLFDNVEKLLDAVKLKNLEQTELLYRDTAVILLEVMDREYNFA